MAMLIALATTAGTEIVAADRGYLRAIGLRLRKHLARFLVPRLRREDTSSNSSRGYPLPEGNAIAQQVRELRRVCNRIGERRGQGGEFALRHDQAKIEETVEAEGSPIDWIRTLEREAFRDRHVSEANPVVPFQQRSIPAAYRLILGRIRRDASILQRFEQPPRAQRESTVSDTHLVVIPPPRRTNVVVVEKCAVPGAGIGYVSVPLHQQDVRRRNVGQ